MRGITPTLVSVCMITYKHEAFIRQAIESVLMQEGEFELELIIADDCSPDRTSQVVEEIMSTHPNGHCVQYYRHQSNIGINANFNFALSKCRGKYLAICEGDDYWTDRQKLKLQVNFLLENDSFSASTHQTIIVYEDSTGRKAKPFLKNTQSEFRLEDLLARRMFHTASLVFRSSIIRNHPLPLDILSADRALTLLLASSGRIGFFANPMCCYRKNVGGVSMWVNTKMLKRDMNILPWISGVNPKFPKRKYAHFIYRTILFYPSSISKNEAIRYSSLYVLSSFSYFPSNLRAVFHFLVYQIPYLLRKIK